MTALTTYNQQFFARLKKLRKDGGYSSQREFAEELGMSANSYATYESRTMLPHKLIPQVCELLNCGPWMLLTGQSDQFAPPSENGDKVYHIDQPFRFPTNPPTNESKASVLEMNEFFNSLDGDEQEAMAEIIELLKAHPQRGPSLMKEVMGDGVRDIADILEFLRSNLE